MIIFGQTIPFINDISILLGGIIGILTFLAFVWGKIIKPSIDLLDSHNHVLKSIEIIKKEVITNGGSSIKDAVNGLVDTCNRIEKRQKVIEQRSRSALYHHSEPLFETDKHGNLIWINQKFSDITGQSLHDLEGYNWMTYIHEEDRESFIGEFSSCLKMCRKFELEVKCTNGKIVKFIANPYKTGESEHEGFLFYISSGEKI